MTSHVLLVSIRDKLAFVDEFSALNLMTTSHKYNTTMFHLSLFMHNSCNFDEENSATHPTPTQYLNTKSEMYVRVAVIFRTYQRQHNLAIFSQRDQC